MTEKAHGHIRSEMPARMRCFRALDCIIDKLASLLVRCQKLQDMVA